MNCARVRDRLADYTVDALEASQRRQIQVHLAACEPCREELRVLEQVGAWVEVAGRREPPPALFQAVRNRIEQGDLAQESLGWRRFFNLRPVQFASVTLAAGMVIAALIAPVGTRPLPPSPEPHSTAAFGSQVARGPLAGSVRRHAQASARGPLAERVAWEAMAQLADRGGAARRPR